MRVLFEPIREVHGSNFSKRNNRLAHDFVSGRKPNFHRARFEICHLRVRGCGHEFRRVLGAETNSRYVEVSTMFDDSKDRGILFRVFRATFWLSLSCITILISTVTSSWLLTKTFDMWK